MENPCPSCKSYWPGCECDKYLQYKKSISVDVTAENGRSGARLEGVTLLGNQNTYYHQNYTPDVLEAFDNAHPDNDYMVSFRCPEFTSLCPKTGQPDFANIIINYIPRTRMVESKSLKLYLFSFRNHGDFHEDCANIIMKDLIKLMNPKYIEVKGIFTPRGGIAIWPFANHSADTKYEMFARSRLFESLTEK